jgi:polyhydroxybutyrate depolymerase
MLAPFLLTCLFWTTAAETHTEIFTVGETKREALVVVPARLPESGAPLVLAFHGHGGTARNSLRKFAVHKHWPEAVVVYLQGLPGVQGITDPDGKRAGWQKNPGEVADRDVKLVDVVLEQLPKKYKIDLSRVYAMGHSNGGRFVNVLWNMRGEKFAAFCSSGGQGGALLLKAQPKPIFIIAGEKDPLVPFEGQKRSIEIVRKLLAVDPSKAEVKGYLKREPGKNDLELETYIHPGGHEFPEESVPYMVQFFQRHSRK